MLNDAARDFLRSGQIAHVTTLRPDGSPHVTMAWVDLDADDRVVFGTLFDQRKLRNLRRDPRIALSFQSEVVRPPGLREYLVLDGRAEVIEGGAPQLLRDLAQRYLGPGTDFPPMPNPPQGYVTRVTIEGLHGVGPWTDD